MIAFTPASSASCGPSENGKKPSEARTASRTSCPSSRGLRERDPHRVHTAHLAGADPDGLESLGEHDRIRVDVFRDPPREEQVAPLLLRELAADELHAVALGDVPVPVLDEHAAEHPAVVPVGVCGRAPLGVVEDAKSRLAHEHLRRLLVEAGREEHLHELTCDRDPERGRHRAVEDDDAAERRDRIGRESLRVRLLDRRRDRDPARVRVLDDRAGRKLELAKEQPRRGEVVQVVERERLAVELLDAGEKL